MKVIYFAATVSNLGRNIGIESHDSFSQLAGHPLGVVGVEVQLPADLLIREVQAPELEHPDPGPQRLVIDGEDRVGRVVEASAAAAALVTPPFRLRLVAALTCPRILVQGL